MNNEVKLIGIYAFKEYKQAENKLLININRLEY